MRPNIQLFPSPDIPIPLAPISAAAPSSAVYYSPTGLLSPARHRSSYCCPWTTVSRNSQLLGLPMCHQAQVLSQHLRTSPCQPQKAPFLHPSTYRPRSLRSFLLPSKQPMQKSCSICLRKPPTLTRLAILAHYGHALCSSCSTSALNIADEKDMECAGCRAGIHHCRQTWICEVDDRYREDYIFPTAGRSLRHHAFYTGWRSFV
ncbi:hypothetical protein BT96DRAFT_613781 [Gymnopus androsaceus JB14]|uniref:RING-type domain-containing protein n=1 Tax=Gymnopus androsaceus JB14 TaxID=1447944 RepID=A0A6A4GHZ6_9AGAR|nr:hypothetical protein BT96DRAFT_613781 [Gymnopus androsaceus JB14]